MVGLPSITSHYSLKRPIISNKAIIFITLIATIIVEDIIIYNAPIDYKLNYTNYILIINSSTAAGFAIILLLKQRFELIHAKIHAAIAIGLVLWLGANITWTVYENILDVVPPVPSIADFFWLAAYPFFAYSAYKTYKEFHKKLQSKKVFLIGLVASSIFIVCMVLFTINLSVFTTLRGIAMFSVIIAFPILNAILIVPAITLFAVFRKEKYCSVPWIFESLSLLILIVADSWFAIIFLTHITEQIWYSSFFLIDHYLLISAGLIWSIKFLIPTNNTEYRSSPVVNRKLGFKIPIRIPFIASIIVLVIISSILINSTIEFFPNVNTNALGLKSDKNTEVLQIGALIGLSGISSQRGESQKAALEVAVEDVNNFLKNGTNIRVNLTIEDTQRDPNVALQKLIILADKGIRIVIGPQTSAELQRVKDYADKNGILLISHSSTAPSLAIPNDNIFRLVQNDSYQAETIANRMLEDGIRIIVPIWRDDVWGKNLTNFTTSKFKNHSETVVFDGIGYKPLVGKFASSLHRINFIMWDQVLKVLSSQVNEAKLSYPGKKVGVYIVASDEIVPILIQAQNQPVLANVSWYGSDGSAMNERILKNVEAAEFAIKTRFPNPVSGVVDDSRVKILESKIENNIGRHPDPYYAHAYDALRIAALIEIASTGIKNIQIIEQNLNKISNSYNGLTGNTSLNGDGDRKYGIYDFWSVIKKDDNSGYEWVKVNDSTAIQSTGKKCSFDTSEDTTPF